MNPIKPLTLALSRLPGDLVGLMARSLPNMVFLMTDDQGWGDVGYNGHPKIKTPHLDDMAATGLALRPLLCGRRPSAARPGRPA